VIRVAGFKSFEEDDSRKGIYPAGGNMFDVRHDEPTAERFGSQVLIMHDLQSSLIGISRGSGSRLSETGSVASDSPSRESPTGGCLSRIEPSRSLASLYA
jgi:hypothetical protein